MKKILLVMLTLAMLIQPVFVQSAELAEYEDLSFVNALGIIEYDEDDILNPEEEVSREFFAKVLVKLSYRGEQVAISNPKSEFADVTDDSPYAGYIMEAVKSGFMQVEGENFRPKEPVSYEELCYGLLRAVDQGDVAEALGDEDAGYTQLADTMRMFDGVSLARALNHASLATVVRNLLDAEYYEFKYNGTTGGREKTEGTILEEFFDLKETEGKLITGRALGGNDNYVEIDGVVYDCDLMLESLLGQRVKAYYNQTTGELVYAERLKNENILIYYDEIVEFSNGRLKYEIAEKSYTVKIAENPASFKNGVQVSFSEQLFFPHEGFINIIKNHGSGEFDTVISTESETVVVGGVNAANYVIYDMYDSGKKIDLEQYGDEVLILKDDKQIEFSDLKKYDSLMVILPEDGKFATIYVTDMSTSGKVSSAADDYLIINDNTKIYYSQYFADFGEPLSLGKDYYVYVDMFGRVVAVQEMASKDEQYAYFLDLIALDHEEGVLLKYMDQKGVIYKMQLPEKVKLNGKSVKTEITNETLNDTFKTGYVYDAVSGYKKEKKDFYVRQPMRIKMNAEGTITAIDTPIKTSSESEDSLMLDNIIPSSTTLRYRNLARQFGTSFGLSSSCVIFGVPNTENDNEDARKDLQNEHYSVLSADSAFRNDGYYGDLYVFDVTDGGACNMLVKRGTASIRSVEPDSSSSLFVVEKVSMGLNDDEEAAYFIKGYMEGKQVEYELEKEELVTPYLNGDALGITSEQRQQKIKSGDIIQISLNMQGRIDGIYFRFDYDNQKTLVPSDIRQNGAGEEDAYKGYYGKVYKSDVNGLRMSDGVNGAMNDFSIANLRTFMSKSISLIYVYDEETAEVRMGTWDDLVSSDFNYTDASKVYVRTRWNDPLQMVIYK